MATNTEILNELIATIASRREKNPNESYVSTLLSGHEDKLLKKIGEEATELVLAAKANHKESIVYESADLLFHCLVMLERQHISVDEIFTELQRRFGLSGLVEKAQRTE